jgi:hypothetical protein
MLTVVVKDFADGQQQPDAAVVPSPLQTLHLRIDRTEQRNWSTE